MTSSSPWAMLGPGLSRKSSQPNLSQRNGRRGAIVEQKTSFAFRQLRRDGNGHQAGRNGAKEEQRIVAGVGHAQHDPVTLDEAFGQQPGRHAAHG